MRKLAVVERPVKTGVYREQTTAFERKFGREMGPEDPFFFDPEAEEPQFRSPGDASVILERMAELLAEAGLEPASVHAFRRTGGWLPTGAGWNRQQAAAWDRAIAEYHRKLRDRR